MTRSDIAHRMADSALAFLDSLDSDSRQRAQWPFSDTMERETWFFTPTDHGGLPLSSMTPHQQKLAHQLLAQGLSESGYNTTALIMGWENVLDRLEGFIRDWGRERGRDPGLYYWRIFGDPSSGQPWSWRVGGHHVSLSHLIIDGEVVASTPVFIGADPARAVLVGNDVCEPLRPLEEPARRVVTSLSLELRNIAIVSDVPPTDIVGANRPRFGEGEGDLPIALPELWRGYLPEPWHTLAGDVQVANDEAAGVSEASLDAVRLTRIPRGVPIGMLPDEQKAVLRGLLDSYAQRLPGPLADVEMAKYSGLLLDEHSFLWTGSTTPGERYYYRIQGPDLLVECDNTQRSGNHIHTVWRDPLRDFGHSPLAEHYRQQHR